MSAAGCPWVIKTPGDTPDFHLSVAARFRPSPKIIPVSVAAKQGREQAGRGVVPSLQFPEHPRVIDYPQTSPQPQNPSFGEGA